MEKRILVWATEENEQEGVRIKVANNQKILWWLYLLRRHVPLSAWNKNRWKLIAGPAYSFNSALNCIKASLSDSCGKWANENSIRKKNKDKTQRWIDKAGKMPNNLIQSKLIQRPERMAKICNINGEWKGQQIKSPTKIELQLFLVYVVTLLTKFSSKLCNMIKYGASAKTT